VAVVPFQPSGKAKGNQVWLLDRNGGEAQQLTDVKGRLTSYDWSPDGKKLLLVMADRDPNDAADDERPGGPAPAAGAKAPKVIVIDRYKFKQDVQGYLTQAPARLYLFDVESKKADALTDATLEAGAPSWSPDGKSIAFLGRSGKDAERYNTNNLFVVEARAGAVPREITHYDGQRARPARSSGVESGRHAVGVPADFGCEAKRLQHEQAGGGAGERGRADDSCGQTRSRSFGAPLYCGWERNSVSCVR
jgi:dipeptidyl aminopeptidase/acylaminoacyl peptidase